MDIRTLEELLNLTLKRANIALQPTSSIGVILASRSSIMAVPIYARCTRHHEDLTHNILHDPAKASRA